MLQSSSNSYRIALLVLFALLFEFVLEPIVTALSQSLGMEANVGQSLFIVAVVLVAPKLKKSIALVVEGFIVEPKELAE